MNVLIVDNGWILMRDGKAFTVPSNREFLHRCRERFDGVSHLCSSPSGAPEQWQGVALDNDLVQEVAVPVSGGHRWSRLFSYIRHFDAIWKAVHRADFLYIFYPGNVPFISVALARLTGKPYGVYLRGELGMGTRPWRWVMSGARFVIAAGNVLADAARGCRGDVELAVPMCSLLENAATVPRPARTQPPWRLLYVGRLEARKGTEDLLEAAALLRERGVDFRLDLVGQNCLVDSPRPGLAGSGDRVNLAGTVCGLVGDYVNLIGVVCDEDVLSRHYTAADLFCFPSHDEGFPRVLYEAMAHGLPIVTTFVGSIPGIMADGVNCLRVEPRSPVMLADAIQKALDDADLRQRLADNGRVTVEPILRRMREESHDTQLARKIAAHMPATQR